MSAASLEVPPGSPQRIQGQLPDEDSSLPAMVQREEESSSGSTKSSNSTSEDKQPRHIGAVPLTTTHPIPKFISFSTHAPTQTGVPTQETPEETEVLGGQRNPYARPFQVATPAFYNPAVGALAAPWLPLFNIPPAGGTVPNDPEPEPPQNQRVQAQLPPRRLKTNVHFGDALEEKEDTAFRLWTQNIHGIKHADDCIDFYTMNANLARRKVDGYCFQETNLNWLDKNLVATCNEIPRKFFHSVTLAAATTNLPWSHKWKPGGTCVAILNQWTTRVTGSGSDSHGLGRWSWVRMGGSGNRSVVIISVYQVCNNNVATAGPNTAFAQQWKLLRLQGRETKPREKCIEDLNAFVEKCQEEGSDIILCGDINEKLGNNPQGFASIAAERNLVDVHHYCHGEADDPVTYSRGTVRIDYVLVSTPLLPFISGCGFDKFNNTIFSDHRAGFLDIFLADFLQGHPPKVTPASRRAISSKSEPKLKTIFTETIYDYLLAHNVLQKLEKWLRIGRTRGHNATVGKHLNAVDKTLSDAIAQGIKQVRKPDRPPWSRRLADASLKVYYWQTYLSQIRTKLDMQETLDEISERLGWDPPEITSCNATKKCLRQARADLKAVRKIAAQHRQDFLDELLEVSRLHGDEDKEKILKRVRRKEQIKAVYKKLQRILKPEGFQSLTKVEVLQETPGVAGAPPVQEWRVINTKAELDKEILSRNQRHFSQAEGTPYTLPPLALVGSSLTDFRVDRLPDGTVVVLPEEMFPETKMIQEILSGESPLMEGHSTISTKVTLTEFVRGFWKWDENTSTSPSGRDLGVYKAIISVFLKPPDLKTAAEKRKGRTTPNRKKQKKTRADPKKIKKQTNLQLKARVILLVILKLLNYSAETGFHLDRWTEVVNAMIYKKPGNFQLEKLRVIHLFEADYNWLIGVIFGRRAMYAAVENHSIHDTQWGSIPGRQAQDCAMMKELNYTMSHLTRTPLALFENDAKSCYDRIVMRLALSIFRFYGVPAEACEMQEKTLKHIKHRIKTALGISEDFYTSTDENPIHGIGQGSKAGPITWVIVHSILCVAMDRMVPGATFTDPFQLISQCRHSEGFVDDVTSVYNDFAKWINADPTVTEVVHGLEVQAQTWERLLFSSGGLLELQKCMYYIMFWTWDEFGAPSLLARDEITRQAGQLKLTSGINETANEIVHKDCSETHTTLGMEKNPAQKHKQAVLAIRNKNDEFARHLASSDATPEEAMTAYFTINRPGATYSLQTTSIEKKDLDKADMKVKHTVLQKSGYSCKTPLAVVNGPTYYGGIGFRPLHAEQTMAKVTQLMKHLRTPGSPLHRFYRIVLQWYQHVAGVSFSVIEHPERLIPHAVGEWFNNLRKSLAEIQGSIHIEHLPKMTPYRIGDRAIMEALLALDTKLTNKELIMVNRCRLYLRVTYISEITTADGCSISHEHWVGERNQGSSILWPRQAKPNHSVMQVWRKALARGFMDMEDRQRVSAKTTQRDLRCYLGNWLESSRVYQKTRWSNFFDSPSDTLFVKHPPMLSFKSIPLHTSRGKHQTWKFRSADSTITNALPSTAVPVDIRTYTPKTGQFHQFREPRGLRILPVPTPPNTAATFNQYVATLPPWERALLVQNEEQHSLLSLAYCLRTGSKLFVVSDGGAKGKSGSFGWVIGTSTSTGDFILWHGFGIAEGYAPGSFRAEGYGTLAALRFLIRFSTFHRIDPPTELFCSEKKPYHEILFDNEGLIKRINGARARKHLLPNSSLWAEFDIQAGIMEAIAAFPAPIKFVHIKGHQDSKKKKEDLPFRARLNIYADALATKARRTLPASLRIVPFIPACEAHLILDGRSITHHFPREIRIHCNRTALFQYFFNHFGWTRATIEDIDWQPFHACMQIQTSSRRRHFTKYINKLLPVGYRMHRREPSWSPKCPTCPHPREDDNHLHSCPSRPHIESSNKTLTKLRAILVQQQTHKHLQRILLSAITHMFSGSVVHFPPEQISVMGPRFVTLVRAQSAIGWDQLFRGKFSICWGQIQDVHLRTRPHVTKTKLQGHLWTKKIVGVLWDDLYNKWSLRNQALHGHTPGEISEHAQRLLHLKVRALYDQQPNMLAADRDVLSTPLDERLQQPPAQIQAFLDWASPIVQISLNDAAEEMRTHQPRILTHFSRAVARIPDHLLSVIGRDPVIPPIKRPPRHPPSDASSQSHSSGSIPLETSSTTQSA
jgi:exonuclease III